MRKIFLVSCWLLLITSAFAGTVDTVSIYSKALKKETRFVIITPSGQKQKADHLPVVYLLHGYSGNYSSWLHDAPQLIAKSDELNMILV